MAITMRLDIVSAEKEVYSGIVEMVLASASEGEVGIFPGHAPMLTSLKPGEVSITMPGGARELFYVSGGVLEVQPYMVTILADEVERADNIDEAAALAAKAHAEEVMSNIGADIDYSVAAIELARAVAQIRALEKARKALKH